MDEVIKSLGITQNVAVLEENENIVASIPFAKYRNFIKGLSALPLQFSGYYNSIIAENDYVKIKLLSKFFEYLWAQNFILITRDKQNRRLSKFFRIFNL